VIIITASWQSLLAEPQEAAAQRAKQAALESQAQELKAQAQEDLLAERRDRLKEIDNVRFHGLLPLSGFHAVPSAPLNCTTQVSNCGTSE